MVEVLKSEIMKQLILLTCLFFGVFVELSAQTNLLPSIGLNTLPSDNDSVCYIPLVTGNFNTNGIQEGDTASDFKLYDLSGDSITLSGKLSTGKPVLMIAGSYTCPVFRNKVASINNVVSTYGNQLEVFIVYTLEAHPDLDTSVYFGYVNTGAANINQGILYRQPRTYGERKDVVQDLLSSMVIQAPVYIDGPCNNWWSHYGPAPNNAYLIDTTGVVFAKHGWYDKFPENIICDIDSLLGNPVNCNNQGSTGSFNFVLLSNDTIQGAPGSTITFSGDLINNSNSDVVVDIYRLQNNLPGGWASSLCADVCYPTTTDTATILIPAGMTQHFYFYIYTDNSIDTARTRVGFRNRDNATNQFARNLFGITESVSGMHGLLSEELSVLVFPNPAKNSIFIETAPGELLLGDFIVYDHSGRLKERHTFNGSGIQEMDLATYSVGIYFIRFTDSRGGTIFRKFSVIR